MFTFTVKEFVLRWNDKSTNCKDETHEKLGQEKC